MLALFLQAHLCLLALLLLLQAHLFLLAVGCKLMICAAAFTSSAEYLLKDAQCTIMFYLCLTHTSWLKCTLQACNIVKSTTVQCIRICGDSSSSYALRGRLFNSGLDVVKLIAPAEQGRTKLAPEEQGRARLPKE